MSWFSAFLSIFAAWDDFSLEQGLGKWAFVETIIKLKKVVSTAYLFRLVLCLQLSVIEADLINQFGCFIITSLDPIAYTSSADRQPLIKKGNPGSF